MKYLQLGLAILLTVPLMTNSQQTEEILKFEDVFSRNQFSPKTVRGLIPMKDGNSFTMLTDSSINVYAYGSGEMIDILALKRDLIPNGEDHPITVNTYQLNNNETMMLIPTGTERRYRHSSKSDYYLYDLIYKDLFLLSDKGKQSLATFSPDNSMVGFVRDNNLFVKHLFTGFEQQITYNGKTNEIINGTTDWVYEEEFSFTKAFFWSPDSRKIAYYSFNEKEVKEFQMAYYNDLYPELHKYRYPKAGEDNSLVSIHVYHLDSDTTIKMGIETAQDGYIPRIKWTRNPNVLSIQLLNRHQNHLQIFLAEVETGTANLMYEERNPYYIDITDNLIFLPDSIHFLITSEMDGFNHIYQYSLDGKLVSQLTKGKWDVTSIYGFDEENKIIYYQSAEVSPLEKHIYRVDLNGNKLKLTTRKGTNTAKFSTNMHYFVNTNSTANSPPYITVNSADGQELRLLEDNQELIDKLRLFGFTTTEFFQLSDSSFRLPDGVQVNLNAYRILPPDFDQNRLYPVLIYVYGGPGSQTVNDSWGGTNRIWFQYLANQGIIVVSVDSRGTGSRGEQFKKMTYLQLGKYETEDLITTSKLLDKFEYIDGERIGVFGWSYGGYMSSLAITKGADHFKSAVAVAPVTSWRFYDNIYTERYMRTPIENTEGYDDNSPINYADKLKGEYLLIHGSADDNVHYQNTMEMAKALVRADKQFEMMIYPDRNHGMHGGNARYHLYKKVTDFLKRTLLTSVEDYPL